MAVVRNKLSNTIKFSIHPLAAILKIKNPPGYRGVPHSPGFVMSATNISSVTQIFPNFGHSGSHRLGYCRLWASSPMLSRISSRLVILYQYSGVCQPPKFIFFLTWQKRLDWYNNGSRKDENPYEPTLYTIYSNNALCLDSLGHINPIKSQWCLILGMESGELYRSFACYSILSM